MIAPTLAKGKWIEAKQFTPDQPRKTPTYRVYSTHDSSILGVILWYSPWRGFAFNPRPHTLFETDCLTTICGWIQTLNQEHKRQLKARKEERDGNGS